MSQERLFHAPSVAPPRIELSRFCGDCDADVWEIEEKQYSVRDEVWPIHPEGGVLCIGCLEARIGRRLVPDDFTAIGKSCSSRLRARLTESEDY